VTTVHFLNVNDGDCSIIQHGSGHTSVIDVCNATSQEFLSDAMRSVLSKGEKGVSGNFQQKKYPVNPVSYLKNHSIYSVFRYIQTHPDMDHMDGIEAFFSEFSPANFWDTENNKEIDSQNWNGSPYRSTDWDFYKHLRDTRPTSDPTRLALSPGARGKYYNLNEDGVPAGDALYVLAPTAQLVQEANELAQDYNRCSYVILYRSPGGRILFSGDSHDATWEYILENHHDEVADIDVLMAPHHGRSSGRSYDFLDVLNPTLTFFGNARSEHLAYSAWNYRNLSFITNNQANCMVIDTSSAPMTLYVTHEHYARRVNPNTIYSTTFQAWYVGPITADLIP